MPSSRNLSSRSRATRRASESSMPRRTSSAADSMQESRGEAGQHAQEAMSDVGRRAQESLEQSSRQFSSFFSNGMKASENFSQQASQGMDAMMQCSSIVADNLQSAMKEWMACVQECMQMNVSGLNDIIQARTLQDVLTAQTRLMREELEMILNSGARISEMSAKTGTDVAQRYSECFSGFSSERLRSTASARK